MHAPQDTPSLAAHTASQEVTTPVPVPLTPARGPMNFRTLLREPLLHFIVLGLLVFAADKAVLAVRGDPQEIVITQSVTNEARQVFMDSMKRQPTAADMKILMDRWVDNEVLYREGLALGLDKGDSSIRERVIFKALSVTQSGLALPPLDDAGLRTWFESNRKRYDEPIRFDFQEAVVPAGSTVTDLQAFAVALNGGGASDIQSSLRIFKDRPLENLLQSYGTEFAEQIARQTVGRWQLIQSPTGSRIIRLEAVKPGNAADYDDIKVRAYQDWKDEAASKMTVQAIREMGKKFRVQKQESAS